MNSGAELKLDKTYTDGRYTELRFLKTRNGFNNARLKFVLDSKSGFHDLFTKLEYAKEKKLLSGSGVSYSFEGTDIKFSFRKFAKIYNTNEDFAEAFDNLILESLANNVSSKQADIEDAESEDYDDLEEEFDD